MEISDKIYAFRFFLNGPFRWLFIPTVVSRKGARKTNKKAPLQRQPGKGSIHLKIYFAILKIKNILCLFSFLCAAHMRQIVNVTWDILETLKRRGWKALNVVTWNTINKVSFDDSFVARNLFETFYIKWDVLDGSRSPIFSLLNCKT